MNFFQNHERMMKFSIFKRTSQFSSSKPSNLGSPVGSELHLNIFIYSLQREAPGLRWVCVLMVLLSLYTFLVVTDHHTEAATHSCGSVSEEMGRVCAQNLLRLIRVLQTVRTLPGSVRKRCQVSSRSPNVYLCFLTACFTVVAVNNPFKAQSSGAVTFGSGYRVSRIRNSSCRRFVQLLRKPWPNLLMAWAELPRALQLN